MELKIFDVLTEVNRGHTDYIETLSPEKIKEVKPYVLMLWMKGAKDNPDVHMILSNLMANPYVFSLGNHPKLLFKLLCVSNGGYDKTRFNWTHKKKTTSSFRQTIVENYYDYSPEEADEALPCLSDDAIREMAEEMGYDEKDIKKGLK